MNKFVALEMSSLPPGRRMIRSREDALISVCLSVCLSLRLSVRIDTSYLGQHCQSRKKAEDKQIEKSVSPPIATRRLRS